MFKKALAVLIASTCVTTTSFAAVLDGDNAGLNNSLSGKLNDWALTFFSIASQSNMKPGKTANSDRAVDSYNYISTNYKLDSRQKVALNLPFTFNTQGQNEYGDQETSNFALGDIHFVYSNYDLGYFGDIDLSGKAKVYLPTSKASQSQGLISKFRFEGYADYQISRQWSVAYVAKPDIYWQSQTANLNDTIPQFDDGNYVTDPRQANKQFGLEHYLQVQYDINSVISFTTKTGFNESWYHYSAVEDVGGDHTTALRLGLSMWIRPVRGLSFTLGVSNDTILNSYKGQDIAIWQPFNTQYSLMTNAYLF